MPTPPESFPFAIVMNAGSGHGEADAAREEIAAILDAAGRSHRFFLIEGEDDIQKVVRAAATHAKATGGALVAAGGDGTINGVAGIAWEEDLVMGVLPQGTFNFFGRTHGIPSGTREATEALLRSTPHDAQIGRVNDRIFLVNASLGLYPQVLEDREAWKQRFGRHRIVALWSGLATMMRGYRPLRIEVSDGERTRSLRTPTLFVGNNALQLEKIGLPEAEDVRCADGRLAGLVLKPIGRLTMLGIVLRGALGKLGEAENAVSFAFREITVVPKHERHAIKVALDGEIVWLAPPIAFRAAPRPLRLLTDRVRQPGEDPG
ncbi:diacylglycerol/lipid kinase family protein [Luteibacter yeojuensis]|uniref:Diacylglycerol kinase n=1 Tax=Luteibacter yeojuensis TaxID=345309 RepID=A0A7X5QUG5_9GAMM|nr:diacylglycerol kinase family protein [Luteibacter yeojuensis]NID15623.1 diacylglycerol kinase [Luteibacter yeojuensis]